VTSDSAGEGVAGVAPGAELAGDALATEPEGDRDQPDDAGQDDRHEDQQDRRRDGDLGRRGDHEDRDYQDLGRLPEGDRQVELEGEAVDPLAGDAPEHQADQDEGTGD